MQHYLAEGTGNQKLGFDFTPSVNVCFSFWLDTNLESSGKGEPQLRNCFNQIG